MSNDLLYTLNRTKPILMDESVYGCLFAQYERVIIKSLITSFGLDFIIVDRYGGDVDTVHNVRKIGVDKDMTYKNNANLTDYEQRGEYSFIDYHTATLFKRKKHEAREHYQETGEPIVDAYTGNPTGYHGHTHSISNAEKTELDHIIECMPIHNDRGRILSGLDGVALANSEENLAFTNKALNASMGAWARGVNDKYRKEHGTDAPMEMLDIKAYINAHPDLDANTKANLLHHYKRAKQAYEAKINHAYYTSAKFWKDSTTAAIKGGFKMGIRQAFGLIFSEIWFAVKDVIVSHEGDGKSLLTKIGEGIKLGIENSKRRYKEIWSLFKEGALAGVMASLTTTLCNIFFTTAKRLVRIVRQSWASLVEATKVVLINPECLPFGERILATSKIIATGASMVAGALLSETIAQTPLGQIPVVGDIVQTFCGTLVAGILSCTFLYLLDNNKIINDIVQRLNKIPTIDDTITYLRKQSNELIILSAKVINVDVEKFIAETNKYLIFANSLSETDSEKELNNKLKMFCYDMKLLCPWKDKDKSFNEVMNDPYEVIHFK